MAINTGIKKNRMLDKEQEKSDKTEPKENTNNIFNTRPETLDSVIGRDDLKKKIRLLINSAKKRSDSIEHMLFYGPPGLGKTTFGYAISKEFGSKFYITSGAAIGSKADMASLVTSLEQGDVLFIDEIHRLNKVVEEFLYPILEDFKMDIVIGKGPLAKVMRLDIAKFTLIGATTKIGAISKPLLDRFGLSFKLDYFELEDLQKIILSHAKKIDIDVTSEAALEIAKRSRGTARIAIRNLRRCRDYVLSRNKNLIDFEDVNIAFKDLSIDELGIDDVMYKYMDIIYSHFDGGPVGLNNLSASLYEDIDTIEEVYEPYLIQIGLIKRTSKGRILTNKGIEYIRGVNKMLK
jgi:Holliday junction DNA helicase RuvB